MIKYHLASIKFHQLYDIKIRLSFFISFLIIILLLLIYPKVSVKPYLLDAVDYKIIEQIDIPQTHQELEKLPTPARPSVPIAAETEDIAEDLTLDIFDFEDFDFLDTPPPPKPETGPQVKFIPYDDPPIPIGGYAAIKNNLIYPELAREAGIEGNVFVQFFVDKKGRVREAMVVKGIPNSGLNEAAVDAIRKTRFIPAKQREMAVGVWISVPVYFKLHEKH